MKELTEEQLKAMQDIMNEHYAERYAGVQSAGDIWLAKLHENHRNFKASVDSWARNYGKDIKL